ncbi:hypothetical protein BJ742DRAFT_671315 [Cladochytrium replicatum]|nr:hypothetical protein BJ742DRAFT_671315 [Cladochytrium replicatum]
MAGLKTKLTFKERLVGTLSYGRDQIQSQIRDRKNFKIEKLPRFAVRFFQIVVAFGSFFFLGRQDSTLLTPRDLWAIINYTWFLSIVSPIISVILVVQYFAPWLTKTWTSRRMLIFESICDVTITFLWIICFSVAASRMGTDCPPGTSTSCDRFNWVLAFEVLSFVFWFAAIVFDVLGLLKGIWGYGEQIPDDVVELNSAARRQMRFR